MGLEARTQRGMDRNGLTWTHPQRQNLHDPWDWTRVQQEACDWPDSQDHPMAEENRTPCSGPNRLSAKARSDPSNGNEEG